MAKRKLPSAAELEKRHLLQGRKAAANRKRKIAPEEIEELCRTLQKATGDLLATCLEMRANGIRTVEIDGASKLDNVRRNLLRLQTHLAKSVSEATRDRRRKDRVSDA